MNIQIYAKPKCFDSKKAERYFKERNIKFQLIDLSKYEMSKGEYKKIVRNFDSVYDLIDVKSKAYTEQFIAHLDRIEDVEERLLSNQTMFRTPIVRNGDKATVGVSIDVWKTWE